MKFIAVNRLFRSSFFRFCLVGAFCAFQNILVLYLLTNYLKLHYVLSIFVQMFYVNTLGFYLNRKYTFTGRIKIGSILGELIKYHGIMLSSSFAVAIAMYFLVDLFKVWYLSAYVILTVLMTIYNFFAHKKWTFNRK